MSAPKARIVVRLAGTPAEDRYVLVDGHEPCVPSVELSLAQAEAVAEVVNTMTEIVHELQRLQKEGA